MLKTQQKKMKKEEKKKRDFSEFSPYKLKVPTKNRF